MESRCPGPDFLPLVNGLCPCDGPELGFGQRGSVVGVEVGGPSGLGCASLGTEDRPEAFPWWDPTDSDLDTLVRVKKVGGGLRDVTAT